MLTESLKKNAFLTFQNRVDRSPYSIIFEQSLPLLFLEKAYLNFIWWSLNYVTSTDFSVPSISGIARAPVGTKSVVACSIYMTHR